MRSRGPSFHGSKPGSGEAVHRGRGGPSDPATGVGRSGRPSPVLTQGEQNRWEHSRLILTVIFKKKVSLIPESSQN